MFIEFPGDFFDAERGFKLGDAGVDLVGFEQREKLLLGGVAILVFADEVAVAAGGRELDALGDEAEFGLFKRVIQFDEGEAPVVLLRRYKRGHDGGLALTVAGGEVIGDKIAEGDATSGKGGVLTQVDYEHVHFLPVRVGVSAEAGEVVHMILECRLDVLVSPSLLFGFIELVDEVADEIEKAGVVEFLAESFDDGRARLFWIHGFIPPASARE